MREKLFRIVALSALLAIVAVLFPSLPAAAVGGSCGACANSFNSCMQARNSDGVIEPWEENICGTMTAICWNQCQSQQYQFCSYNYDFYACGSFYSGMDWVARTYASHYCSNDYLLMGSTGNCF